MLFKPLYLANDLLKVIPIIPAYYNASESVHEINSNPRNGFAGN
jgi:hypothetical protein